MWSRLPVSSDSIDCTSPFSFYFDLIGRFSRLQPNPYPLQPLHRICTLMRKMAVRSAVVEPAYSNAVVCTEIDDLDKALGGNGAAEAICISFFSGETQLDSIENLADDSCLGQVVIINYRPASSVDFTYSYIYQAILQIPKLPSAGPNDSSKNLLNNYILADGEFEISAGGKQFSIDGIYYCQQNGLTGVCAHSCLRMALNTATENSNNTTNDSINTTLNIGPPILGLTLDQIVNVIADDGLKAQVTDCTNLSPATYTSLLDSIIESGFIALLVFKTSGPDEHVVTVFGHTRNSDEWHPQALPAYSGPGSSSYYPSSQWTDHFLIHDDNFGPYYCLSSKSFDGSDKIEVHWIIGIYPTEIKLSPLLAEPIAAIVLDLLVPKMKVTGSDRWLDYMNSSKWKYILRTLLVRKDQYLDHIKKLVGHDNSKMAKTDMALLNTLPDLFWIAEFSLPGLFTGNRSKLGEVILDAKIEYDPKNFQGAVVGVRAPGLLLLIDKKQAVTSHVIGLKSHSAMFRQRYHEHEW